MISESKIKIDILKGKDGSTFFKASDLVNFFARIGMHEVADMINRLKDEEENS